MKPHQTTLAVDLPFEQTLENFVAGENLELVQVLKSSAHDFLGIWVFGDTQSGKSHLLRGAVQAAQESAGFVDGKLAAEEVLEQLRFVADYGDLVAIDNVAHLQTLGEEAELLLFNLYQRLFQNQGTMIVSHSAPATTLDFATADLNSRLRSFAHYQIQPLNDEQKTAMLKQRAEAKGYLLDAAVVAYWLARGPRDIGALLADLDRLDRASLSQQRLITIPLLKEELGY